MSCCRWRDSPIDFRAKEDRPGNQGLPASMGQTKIACSKTDCLSFAKDLEINGIGGKRYSTCQLSQQWMNASNATA